MQVRTHSYRASILRIFALLAVIASLSGVHVRAQDEDGKPEQHGRKYKSPPETSHIEVTVLKGFNQKPIDGAHVVFHPVKDGHDEGNLEVKTHADGKVMIDVIPTGSAVRIQVIADGFATFAEDYVVTEPSRQIVISMIRPRAQISTYTDNGGRESQREPGVQEPIRPKTVKHANPPSTPVPSSPGGQPQQ